MLMADNLVTRSDQINASEAPIICGDDVERIVRLWEVKMGLREPDDLSDVWPVQLGIVTEELNLDWVQRYNGIGTITRRGEEVEFTREVNGIEIPFRVTLDGVTEFGSPINAKHTHTGAKGIREKYAPQVYLEMMAVGARSGYLSVIYGSQEPRIISYDWDEEYAQYVLERCAAFWEAVQTALPPASLPEHREVKAFRMVDMTGNNQWADAAGRYIATVDAAKSHQKAKKDLLAMFPDDAVEAVGHGIRIKRTESGRRTISLTDGDVSK